MPNLLGYLEEDVISEHIMWRVSNAGPKVLAGVSQKGAYRQNGNSFDDIRRNMSEYGF